MIEFKDKDGREYLLSRTTYRHIKEDHCIADPCSFIRDTLLEPFVIVEDKNQSDRWIYHKDYRKGLFKVVVVDITDWRIKTAFVSDRVKGGRIIWIDRKNLIG